MLKNLSPGTYDFTYLRFWTHEIMVKNHWPDDFYHFRLLNTKNKYLSQTFSVNI